MNRLSKIILAAIALILACLNASHAQRTTPPKMATVIPREITTPDTVETRLGTLRFFHRYPDAQTVQKAYDHLDFTRAAEVFLNTMPGASLYAMREGLKSDKGKGGKFLVLPPGYAGEVPTTGYFVAKSPTYGIWLGARDLLVKGDPKAAVAGFKKRFRIHPLAMAATPPRTTFINLSGKAFGPAAAAGNATSMEGAAIGASFRW